MWAGMKEREQSSLRRLVRLLLVALNIPSMQEKRVEPESSTLCSEVNQLDFDFSGEHRSESSKSCFAQQPADFSSTNLKLLT